MEVRAKHKLCRRIGGCLWGSPKCPSAKRPFPAGMHGKNKQKKLSTYGELLLEKQKLKTFYAITEKQLRIAYTKAKKGKSQTDHTLLRNLEMRLCSVIYRSGFAKTIFAAKQFVNHRHVKVNGRTVDKNSFLARQGDVLTIDPQKSPSIAQTVKSLSAEIPPYMEIDRDNCKITITREPVPGEMPCNFEIMRVIEFYAR